jgi:hypothetical protein
MGRTSVRVLHIALLRLGVLLAALVAALPAGAQPAEPDAGLRVEGIMADYQVQPGQVIRHPMNVRLGKDAPTPLDVLVEPRGLGQALDGATLALEPGEDTTPYSARTFITNIDTTTFHLEPGAAQNLTATITVPEDVRPGTRYADIYVHTKPTANGRVGVVLAAHVTVILTVPGFEFRPTGSISKLDIQPVQSGKPIQATTVFQNTSDRHFRANALVAITDANGKQLAQMLVPHAGSSILPGFPRAYNAIFPLLDKLDGLPPGTYGAESKIVLDDGSLIDERKTTFQVTAPYQPFPDLDPNTVTVVTYNDEEPGPIDARLKSDLRLVFKDTGKVSGTVVLGRFANPPANAPRISDSLGDGGLARPGVKFWGVAVQGFTRGTAELTGFYRDQELNGLQPNSLFLADHVPGTPGWTKLDNLGVFPNAQNVRGELAVNVLSAAVPIVLSGDPASATLLDVLSGNWLVIAAALLLAAGTMSGVIWMVRRRRSRSQLA